MTVRSPKQEAQLSCSLLKRCIGERGTHLLPLKSCVEGATPHSSILNSNLAMLVNPSTALIIHLSVWASLYFSKNNIKICVRLYAYVLSNKFQHHTVKMRTIPWANFTQHRQLRFLIFPFNLLCGSG